MAARPVLQIDPQRRSRCPLFAIFLPPRISERYNLAGRIACDAASFVKIAHVASPDGTGPNNYCRPLFSPSLSAGFDPFFSFAGGLSRAGGCTFWSAGRGGFTCFPSWFPACGWGGWLAVGGGGVFFCGGGGGGTFLTCL